MEDRVQLQIATEGGYVFRLRQLKPDLPLAKVRDYLLHPTRLPAYEAHVGWERSDPVLVTPRGSVLSWDATVTSANAAGKKITILPFPPAGSPKEAPPPSANPPQDGLGRPALGVREEKITLTVSPDPKLGGHGWRIPGLAPSRAQVLKLRKLISAKKAIPLHTFRFTYRGEGLNDETTLLGAGITSDATVDLELLDDKGNVVVKVANLDGDVMEASVSPAGTVGDIAAKVATVWGIPRHRQQLVLRGRQLQEGERLDSVGVVQGTTVHLVERPGDASSPSLPSPSPGQSKCPDCHMPTSTPFCGSTGRPHLTTCPDCGHPPSTTPFCPTSGARHSVSSPAAHPPPPGGPGGSQARSRPPITLSVLCGVDGKEYRLPSLLPDVVTAHRVKALLAAPTGIPIGDQVLRDASGAVLADTTTLAASGITDSTIIKLTCRSFVPPPVNPSFAASVPHTPSFPRRYPSASPPSKFAAAHHHEAADLQYRLFEPHRGFPGLDRSTLTPPPSPMVELDRRRREILDSLDEIDEATLREHARVKAEYEALEEQVRQIHLRRVALSQLDDTAPTLHASTHQRAVLAAQSQLS
eukprot:Sspe_Gene.10127::Locus_3393_Transcript_2_2_Confidence_0.667_Length_1906::g.10127::m.10127